MEREIRWPAQERSIFWDDYTLMGRIPDFERLEDHFGKVLIVYGPVRASKTGSSLLSWSPISYFSPAGIGSWCFIPKILEGHMENAVSRTGLQFQGKKRYIARAEEILSHAGDRIKRDVIVVPECMMLDSTIIDVAHELATRGKVVLLDGLDLSYRGEYFPFQDYHNGKTMADLIASIPPEQRFPRRSYCTAEINEEGDRCRKAARFTQRRYHDDRVCEWYDELIKIRPYEERTATGNTATDKSDKYRVACAEHLVVSHHEVPRFVRGLVGLPGTIRQDTILSIAKKLKQDPCVVQKTLTRMLYEHHIEEQDGRLILPRRYAA